MGRKKERLKPDIIVKNYWRNNEQFADFFNAALFGGKQIIRDNELEDIDTENSTVLEHKEYVESIGATRDNIKISKKSTAYDVEFTILGIENQEHIHYAMPMRVMGYDYGTYKKQYDDNAVKYKKEKGLSENEYLSKMRKTDRFTPIITIVVYYGEEAWDGAFSLHGMLNIPEVMKPFVNDYKMHLVEARKNNLVFHNINNKDLFNLFEILLDNSRKLNETKEKAIEYAREHKVDKSVIMTVAGATNRKMDYNSIVMKGDADMCTVFEETWKEGVTEGEIQGRAQEIVETGIEFGFSDVDILARLQKKLNITSQKAQEYLSTYGQK